MSSADILIATPGRLVDLIENEGIRGRFDQLGEFLCSKGKKLTIQRLLFLTKPTDFSIKASEMS